ncbi:MAG: hypothetical protein BWK73_20175 [Thiothrix lacustris]|uniref:Recombination-associated protein RdgC n=1 Tax=Thiothrix lacustris TaxID=525917 RepID=A0A1Y1QP71_9GAMM|nr:MAG: hypothetical protein BWK73_20175 [Thiothrix lacustris]
MLTNLHLYDIVQPINFDELPACIEAAPFTPCAAMEDYRIGFVAPLAGADGLSYSTLGHTLLQARIQTKKVPAQAVKTEVDAWLKQQRDTGVNPSKSVRTAYKEAVIDEMLPSVIPVDNYVYVWIDANRSTLAVDTASEKVADDVLKLLRDSLGSLGIAPFGRDMPSSNLTAWLREDSPATFWLHDSCALAGKSGEKYTVAKAVIPGDAIIQLLDEGASVTKLGLVYEDEVEFVLTDKFNLQKIKFTDVLATAMSDELGESESVTEHAAGAFIFTAGTLQALLSKLSEVTL